MGRSLPVRGSSSHFLHANDYLRRQLGSRGSSDSSEYPLAALILLPAFASVQLGMMTVIAAMIVDQQVQARESDQNLQHMMHEEELADSYSLLEAVFKDIDSDGSGELDTKELIEAFKHQHDFREIMQVLDITEEICVLLWRFLILTARGR